MPTVEEIRELCRRVAEAKDQEFEAALLELANALDQYALSQKTNGKKAEAE
jgi:hypothetical protein